MSVARLASDPAHALLLLLIAGHLLGDFLLQTRRMVAGKVRLRVLAGHSLLIALAHLTAVLPFLSWTVAAAVLLIGALHGTIDGLKSRWPWSRPDGLGLFLADQLAHFSVVLVVWLAVLGVSGTPALAVPASWLGPWLFLVVLVAALAFTWTGGSSIVSGVLDRLSPDLEEGQERDSGVPGSGRLIGMLERTLTLILILLGQWAAMALVLTAKSVARFEELKERRFAEYYLVGTLTSLLVAVAVALALRAIGY